MEYTIRAPDDGTVMEFYCQIGELVEGDVELLNFVAKESA